jgi:hypothetical protein
MTRLSPGLYCAARPGSLPPGVSSGVPPLYAVAPSGEGAGVPMSFEAGQLFERYDISAKHTQIDGMICRGLVGRQVGSRALWCLCSTSSPCLDLDLDWVHANDHT